MIRWNNWQNIESRNAVDHRFAQSINKFNPINRETKKCISLDRNCVAKQQREGRNELNYDERKCNIIFQYSLLLCVFCPHYLCGSFTIIYIRHGRIDSTHQRTFLMLKIPMPHNGHKIAEQYKSHLLSNALFYCI